MAISQMSPREQALPPLPPDVIDLRFNEFFKMPVGSFGLEPTKKLISLQGKKVRLLGYMTREEQPAPGVFILASLPVQGAEVADGPADDLPPTATFVHVAVNDQCDRETQKQQEQNVDPLAEEEAEGCRSCRC